MRGENLDTNFQESFRNRQSLPNLCGPLCYTFLELTESFNRVLVKSKRIIRFVKFRRMTDHCRENSQVYTNSIIKREKTAHFHGN